MKRRALLAVAASVLLANPSFAQDKYPSKPIRLVVPFAPGGSSSIVARAFAGEMSKGLGQEIIIDNRPGGAGNIAMEAVAKAEPDGYTLIIGHIGTLAVNPFMFASCPSIPIATLPPFRCWPRCQASSWSMRRCRSRP